jgi:xanthine/uracil/vitamin C permease (AzgA family)
MFSGLRKVDLSSFTDGLPVLMMVMITLIANSFGTGIAGGLLFYIMIKTVAGKWREIPLVYGSSPFRWSIFRHPGEALSVYRPA